MAANLRRMIIPVKEDEEKKHTYELSETVKLPSKKAKAKSEEEGGVKAMKKALRALRHRARYLEKKMAIVHTINPKTKDLKEHIKLLKLEQVNIRRKISASMD